MKTLIRLDRTDAGVVIVTENRMRRFFGTAGEPDCGVCAGFERLGDRLWQADEIAARLANQAGGKQAVIDRFRFSVRAGGFGPPASEGRFAGKNRRGEPLALSPDQRSRAETTRNLIDLDSAVLRPFEPGQYSLRPSILVADTYAPYMRARQSIWAHWIAAQGWPVPPEFAAPLIEGEAVAIAGALPAPTGTRTSRDAAAEDAAGKWLRDRHGLPKMTKQAARADVEADIGRPLTGAAFKRAWDDNADPEWKKSGRPKKSP